MESEDLKKNLVTSIQQERAKAHVALGRAEAFQAVLDELNKPEPEVADEEDQTQETN